MKIEELIIKLNDAKDVTIYKELDNYLLLYQNDSFNISLFNKDFLPRIRNSKIELENELLGIVKVIEDDSYTNVMSMLFSGMMIIYDKKRKKFLFLELISRPTRMPQDPLSEPELITGSRDGFVENIKFNVTLLRQRIKDESLHIDELILGRKSKTRINILSIDNVTNKGFLGQTNYLLNKLDVDAILTLEDITTIFQKNAIMPQYLYTGAPDLASRHLLDGSVVILVDNIPNAICLPNTINSFLKNRIEGVNLRLYQIMERTFIYTSLFLSIFFLSIILCFITFQSDSLSLLVLSTIKVTQRGVFLPVIMEILFVLFLFELYYIVSFKSPKLTLSSMVVMVGGIIIGQNTVQSGMVGVFLITIVALCFLSSFTISSNITFVMSISLLRIILLFCSLFLGLFGLTLGTFFVVCKISNESQFGMDYLSPLIPFKYKEFKDSLLYDSSLKLKFRPNSLRTITRKKKK